MNKLKENLDRIFSLYIRTRDCRDIGRCISCGKSITITSCDAGHYISRIHTSTRWNIVNVNAQCKECNQIKNGNLEAYREQLINKWGIKSIEALEAKKNTSTRMTKSSYKVLIDFYKKQLRYEQDL